MIKPYGPAKKLMAQKKLSRRRTLAAKIIALAFVRKFPKGTHTNSLYCLRNS